MLAANFTEIHMAPVDPDERVRQEVWERTVEFYRRLFSRRLENGVLTDDLADIVAADFIEDEHPDVVHQEGHVAVRGISGLRRYREQFDGPDGPPLLVRLETIAVPATQTWEIPGTDGEQYDSGAVLRFGVRPPGRGELSEEAAAYDGPLMYVPLREELQFKRDRATHQLMVARRMYLGVGEQGYLGRDTIPRNHGELVGQQIGYIAANGREMPMASLPEVYGVLFPGVEIAPV